MMERGWEPKMTHNVKLSTTLFSEKIRSTPQYFFDVRLYKIQLNV